MKLVYLLALFGVIHLAGGGIGSNIITNLVSQTGAPTYGGSRGFLPGDDSPYSAFGKYLYGDGEPGRQLPGADQSGIAGLMQYGVFRGACMMSEGVTFLIILATFSYPVIDIIPTEGFGLWIRLVIHILGVLGLLVVGVQLLEWAIRAGVFSNVYLLIAIGIVSSAGLLSNIVVKTGGFQC